MKIDKKPFFYKEFSNKNINCVSNLFSDFGEIKSWEKVMDEFNLDKKFYFKWYQIIHTIPSSWKLTLLNDNRNCQNPEYLRHHLIKNNQILALEKLIPKELYSLSIFLKTEIPTSRKYFIRLFPNLQCDWKDIYLLPRKVTIDTKLRIFQYKLLSNILYLNKHLFMYRKKDTKHCSFCKLQDETINYLFVECNYSKNLWRDLKTYCQPSFSLPFLCPQSATFGFSDIDLHSSLLLNHISLLYKHYIYYSRDSAKLSLAALTRFIKKVYVMEKRLSFENEKKSKALNKKWRKMMLLNDYIGRNLWVGYLFILLFF